MKQQVKTKCRQWFILVICLCVFLSMCIRDRNEDGKLLSMNIWTDEAAVERWRNAMQHSMSQNEGREKLFESYKITVCSEIRSYTNTERTQAPQDSNQYFELEG